MARPQITPVTGSGNVEKSEFVSALVVVAGGDFYRVACIAQLDKVNALDDASARDVQAGNDALSEQYELSNQPFSSSARS